jgi:hypothetical protein
VYSLLWGGISGLVREKKGERKRGLRREVYFRRKQKVSSAAAAQD